MFAWLASAHADRRIVAGASALACLCAITVLGPANILVLAHGAPEGATRFSTGAHLTFDRYGTVGGSLVVAAASAICAWLSRSFAWRGRPLGEADPPTPLSAAFTISWLTAVPLFLLKDSYDYRFVLWLPMLAFAMRLASHAAKPVGRLGKAMLASFAFAAYVELACAVADAASSPAWVVDSLVLGKHVGMWNLVFASSVLLYALLRSQRQHR
jgi:hypothetical protein